MSADAVGVFFPVDLELTVVLIFSNPCTAVYVRWFQFGEPFLFPIRRDQARFDPQRLRFGRAAGA